MPCHTCNFFLLSKQFFVLINTFYCMQVLHVGGINIAHSCKCCMQVLHVGVINNTWTIGLRHSLNKKIYWASVLHKLKRVQFVQFFREIPIHFHCHSVSGIYPIRDGPIIFGVWYISWNRSGKKAVT